MSSRSFPAGQVLKARLSAESVIVVGLIAWWLTSMNLPDTVFPSPVNVFIRMSELAVDREFWTNAGVTGGRILAALIIATVCGTAIGLLPRYVPWTRGIVDDVLIPFFTSFPAVAWAILGAVWFGMSP